LPGGPSRLPCARRRAPVRGARPRRDRLPEDSVKLGLAHPELAPLIIAAALIVTLCVIALVRRRRALAAFAGPGSRLASASPGRQIAKLTLVGGACGLVVLALG